MHGIVEERTAVTGDRLRAVLAEASNWRPLELRSHPGLKGWSGLDLPERLGGAANPASRIIGAFRECGRVDLELRDLPGAGHARVLTLAPSRRFDDFLRSVAAGSAYCGVAITEPGAGSDLHNLATAATPVSGGYRLDGVKQHVARIEECTHLIVFAAIRRSADNPLITAFLVPRDAPGVTVERLAPMGMANVSWGRVHFAGVAVDGSQRIGGEGQALTLFVRHFSYWRTMMAAAALGCAEAAVDMAIERMKSREAFGGPIGRFTHLQQDLARHTAQLHMAWLLVESVARAFDERRWPIFDAAMAKAEALEASVAATQWAMSVFGAAGYDSATGIEKRFRDLLGLRIADGTTDVLRGQVARAILGEQLYELSLNRNIQGSFSGGDARRRFW